MQITFDLPEHIVDHIKIESEIRKIEPADYITRLVSIDVLEDQLAVLKYKPMIDRF